MHDYAISAEITDEGVTTKVRLDAVKRVEELVKFYTIELMNDRAANYGDAASS
jgi:hypothetical protein